MSLVSSTQKPQLTLKTTIEIPSRKATAQDGSSSQDCYLTTKSGRLTRFVLEFSATDLLIVTPGKNTVKSSAPLNNIHIKECPAQPREQNSSDQDTGDESPVAKKVSPNCWYPLKFVVGQSKSRNIHFESLAARKTALTSILRAQGFRSQFDQYAIEKVIGEGSCNPVWFAKHRITGAKVAIKAVETSKYARITTENQISESEAMQVCSGSDYVARLVECFEHENQTLMVTKFYKGGDLLSYLTSRGVAKLSESHSRLIVSQIAKGVRDIHANDIAHRDLKHLNIFLNDSSDAPKVKIADFGLSAKLQEDEQIKKMAGTIGFMAPEVVKDEYTNSKVDIWSLGVILFALISSRVPFSGKNRDETAENIISQKLAFDRPVWETVSDDCKNLLTAMLDKNAATRPSIETVLSHPWFARAN